MLRRSNPPGPLGPTAAHLPASTCMLDTLTLRVFLLSVATIAWIMALDTFKKIYNRQPRMSSLVHCTPGMSSLFCAFARMVRLAVSGDLRSAERKAMASMNRTAIAYDKCAGGIKSGIKAG